MISTVSSVIKRVGRAGFGPGSFLAFVKSKAPDAGEGILDALPPGYRLGFAETDTHSVTFERLQGKAKSLTHSLIVGTGGPLSNPTPAVRPWPWERVFMPEAV